MISLFSNVFALMLDCSSSDLIWGGVQVQIVGWEARTSVFFSYSGRKQLCSIRSFGRERSTQ